MKTFFYLLILLGVLFGALESSAQDENYVIVPDDLVEVKVFQEDDLETRSRVASDGTIILPLVDGVSVGGKSVAQAASQIRSKFRDGGFLVNPQVSITVLEYSKRLFTILGQVQKPGSFEFPDNKGLTLLQALGFGGGYTKLANPANIIVRRKGAKGEQVFKLNAKAMARDHSAASFQIEPNDVITVGETLF